MKFEIEYYKQYDWISYIQSLPPNKTRSYYKPINNKVIQRGSQKSCAKLNEAKVYDIKQMLKNTDLKQYEIAEMYGVKPTIISQIKTGIIWKHVEE